MRATKLLAKLTIYYLVIVVIVFAAVKIAPQVRGYLPIGGVEQLITQPAQESARGERCNSCRACQKPG